MRDYDMTIFHGTKYEGLTYLQLRRRLSKAQVSKLRVLGKRSRKAAGFHKASKMLAREYAR